MVTIVQTAAGCQAEMEGSPLFWVYKTAVNYGQS